MMFHKKIPSPIWPLRIGFGLMYLYSSQSIFLNSDQWTWALPDWFNSLVTQFMPIETYLRIQAAGEFVMALVLLAWFIKPSVVKYVAILSIIEMFGIIILTPTSNFSITFRDLGLLGGSLALFLLLLKEESNQKTDRY